MCPHLLLSFFVLSVIDNFDGGNNDDNSDTLATVIHLWLMALYKCIYLHTYLVTRGQYEMSLLF